LDNNRSSFGTERKYKNVQAKEIQMNSVIQ